MRGVRLFAIASALTLGTSVLAGAQDHGKAGITIGYPGDVGVLWHVTDVVAVRPVFSFRHSSGDSTSGGSTSGSGAGIGVSALFYLKKYDRVQVYVSPQYTYTHNSATTTPTTSTTQTSLPSVTTTGDSNGGNGAFGVQYTPSKHFAAYGEFGIGYTHSTSHFDATGISSNLTTSNSWGTFAGVGVVFYP